MKISQTEKRLFGQLSIAGCPAVLAWTMAVVMDPLVDSLHPLVKMLCGVVILGIGLVGFIMWLHIVKNELLPYVWKHFKR